MSGVLLQLRQWAVVILAAAVALLWALHLHDAKVHAADRWQHAIDAQNRAALADSNRILENGWSARLAVIAKDSADLASLGIRCAALAKELDGLKREKAKPIVAIGETAEVRLPGRVLAPVTDVLFSDHSGSPGLQDLSPGPSPTGEGSNLEKRYREDDTCGSSEFHFAMTLHGDSLRFEKSMRIDLSTMLVERADGKREFRGRSDCPWITVRGIEGAVFECAPAVPEKKGSVWTSKAAWAVYGAVAMRLVQGVVR